MTRRPSERRNFKEALHELNLTPVMNLIMLLIPCLLVSMVFVEVSVINAAMPHIGPPRGEVTTPVENLDLAVVATSRGYTVTVGGAALPGPTAGDGLSATGPTLPLVERQINCVTYRGTVPPPRARNAGATSCSDQDAAQGVLRAFTVFDTSGLTRTLADIKKQHPAMDQIILSAEPDLSWEVVVEMMDASRELRDPISNEVRSLFPEVAFRPLE